MKHDHNRLITLSGKGVLGESRSTKRKKTIFAGDLTAQDELWWSITGASRTSSRSTRQGRPSAVLEELVHQGKQCDRTVLRKKRCSGGVSAHLARRQKVEAVL
jgi:hypothetical protein